MVAMSLLRQRGKDFDVGRHVSSVKELIEMGGLFPLKDIQGRLTIPIYRLRKMQRGDGEFALCFKRPFADGKRKGIVYVDIRKLENMVEKRVMSTEFNHLAIEESL